MVGHPGFTAHDIPLGAPAAWADVPDFTTRPGAKLLDLPSQILFPGVDPAGADNIVLACRQIEVLIILFDLLEVILGGLQVILGGRR